MNGTVFDIRGFFQGKGVGESNVVQSNNRQVATANKADFELSQILNGFTLSNDCKFEL